VKSLRGGSKGSQTAISGISCCFPTGIFTSAEATQQTMRPPIFPPAPLAATLLAAALCGCKPPAPSSGAAPKAEVEFREDGFVYTAGTNQKYSGVYVATTNAGNVRSEQRYVDGVKHGPYTLRTAEHGLRRRTDYLWGEEVRDRKYYLNGQLMHDLTMRDGTPDGLVRMWHNTGTLKEIATVRRVGKGVRREGHRMTFDPDGKITADQIYRDHKLQSGFGPEASLPSHDPDAEYLRKSEKRAKREGAAVPKAEEKEDAVFSE
jgi:hypothetical protein